MNDKNDIRMEDVFDLTPAGAKQLQDSQTALSAIDLELLVLIDGRSTVQELIRRLSSIKADVAEDQFRGLLYRGLIAPAVRLDSDSLDSPVFSARNRNRLPPPWQRLAARPRPAPRPCSNRVTTFALPVALRAGARL